HQEIRLINERMFHSGLSKMSPTSFRIGLYFHYVLYRYKGHGYHSYFLTKCSYIPFPIPLLYLLGKSSSNLQNILSSQLKTQVKTHPNSQKIPKIFSNIKH